MTGLQCVGVVGTCDPTAGTESSAVIDLAATCERDAGTDPTAITEPIGIPDASSPETVTAARTY